MPRKFQYTTKKSHRSASKNHGGEDNAVATQVETVETTETAQTTSSDVSTQTDDALVGATEPHSVTPLCTETAQTTYSNVSTQTDDTLVGATEPHSVTPLRGTTGMETHLMSPLVGSRIIQLPINMFYSLTVKSLSQLQQRLQNARCIDGWFILPCDISCNLLKLVKISDQVIYTVEISDDLQWSVCLPNSRLFVGAKIFQGKGLPPRIASISDLQTLLLFLSQCTICCGNADTKFAPVVAKCKGIFKDRTGTKTNAYYDHQFHTIRHSDCEWLLLDSGDRRCSACKKYRNNYLGSKLRSIQNRTEEQDAMFCAADSHVNYRCLDTPQKLARMKNLHSVVRKQNAQIKTLKQKLQYCSHNRSVSVDDQTSEGLAQLVQHYSQQALKGKDEESFHSIFWKQQLQMLTLKNKKQIRWDPLIIRWALYLHHRSSGAYEMLKKSGIVQLPSSRTLRDYRHLSTTQPGFTSIADKQLLDLVQQVKPRNMGKYVFLLLDEMYIKEGLVYNKSTGALIGFSDLGGTLQEIDDYERKLESNEHCTRPLAKTMFVMMVRGVFCKINFPFAQFPLSSAKAEDIFPLVWKAIARLELNGLHVLGITADGASVNRKVFRMHGERNKLTYKSSNIFSDEQRDILFFSDPPHLLKTIRNALASTSRKLWCEGQSISWDHVRELYERNVGSSQYCGVAMVHKLTMEHVRLTSFSKMRVNLAAQVMSESVSKAILLTGGAQAFETSFFIQKVDKFFDCLNVVNFHKGRHARKQCQMPYFKEDDFRLQYLKEFLAYLDQWKKSVNKRQGFSIKEKQMMMLPRETLDGIRMTVLSFCELLPYIFKIPGVTCFLSCKINQDILEKFFGLQRQAGRCSENPTVAEFIKTTENFRVVCSIWVDNILGNCRGRKLDDTDLQLARKPLRKRKRRRSS